MTMQTLFPAANPYRISPWTTPELHRQKEYIQWVLAEADLECDDTATREQTIELYLLELNQVEEEIDRRKRIQQSKYAPKFRKGPTIDRSEQIRKIKATLSVEEFLRRYGVPLRRIGHNLVSNCPLPDHDDRTPSFTIYPDDHWHCFGCQRHGDIFELARWILDERSFPRIVEQLSKEAGL